MFSMTLGCQQYFRKTSPVFYPSLEGIFPPSSPPTRGVGAESLGEHDVVHARVSEQD